MEAERIQPVVAAGGELAIINRLPAEMLTMIMGNLTVEEDLNSAHNVCNRWLEVINSHVGFPVRLSSHFWFERRGERAVVRGLDILPMIGTRELRIEEDERELLPATPPTSLKNPAILKTLVLQLDVGRTLFRMLTGTKTTALTELELSPAAFLSLQRTDVEVLPFADSLQKLSLTDLGGVRPEVFSVVRPIVHSVLTGNRFRKLTLFNYEYPLDDAATLMLIDFILRHPSLTQLFIGSRMYGNELVIEEEDRLELVRRIRGRRVWPSFVELKIINFGADDEQQRLSLWIELIEAMVGVESLFLMIEPCLITPALISRVVNQNWRTLCEFGIDEVESSLNLQIFATATSLTRLLINDAPDFRGAAYLPPSLTHLDLGGWILGAEFRHLLFGLPSLTRLSLDLDERSNAPLADENLYQLSLQTFKEFIMSQRAHPGSRSLKNVDIQGDQVADWPDELQSWEDGPNPPIVEESPGWDTFDIRLEFQPDGSIINRRQ